MDDSSKTAERSDWDSMDDDAPPDLEDRVLCPDGACIGVIGPDGMCKVCGTPGEDPPAPRMTAPSAEPGEEDATGERPEELEAPGDEASEVELDLEGRVLCSDGTCVGVIGPDGHCKECGKLYAGDSES